MAEVLVPNSPHQDRYRAIVKAVHGLETLGIKPVRTQFIRWMVSEPGSDLWGDKSEEEAVLKMSNAIPGLGRETMPVLVRGRMSRADNLPNDLSQRAFVGYLDHLVENGWLTKVGRGKYRLNQGEFTLARFESHPGPRRTIGMDSPGTDWAFSVDGVEKPIAQTTTSPLAVGISDGLDEEEERLVTAIGDTLSLLVDALSLVWGPDSQEKKSLYFDPEQIDPEDLPPDLRDEDPEDLDLYTSKGVPVGLAVMAKRHRSMRKWKDENEETYAGLLRRVREQLEESRQRIGEVVWATKEDALEIEDPPFWGPEHERGLWKRDDSARESVHDWDRPPYNWG